MIKNRIFKKIFINTSSQILSKGITVLLGFLTLGLLTRYLGVERYGIYNLAFAYLAFYGIFADFGLQLTLVKDFSGSSDFFVHLKKVYFSLKLILTILSTLLALIVLLFFPYSQTIKIAILFGAAAVSVGQINSYGAAVLQSKIKLDLVALLEIINRVVTVSAIVIFIYLNLGLYAIILAVLIGNLASALLNIYLAPEFYHIANIGSFKSIVRVFKYAFPVGVTSLLALLYFKVDMLMLSVMKSTFDVGIYSLSYKLFENIIMLWSFYMASIFPLMSAYIQRNDMNNLKKILKMSMITFLVFLTVTISIGFAAAPLAIDILGGKEFIASILPFRILLCALPFVLLNNIFYFLLLSFAKVRRIFIVLVISLVFNFVINLLIIPKFTYIGTSVSTIVTEFIATLGYSFVIIRFIKSNPAQNFLK